MLGLVLGSGSGPGQELSTSNEATGLVASSTTLNLIRNLALADLMADRLDTHELKINFSLTFVS